MSPSYWSNLANIDKPFQLCIYVYIHNICIYVQYFHICICICVCVHRYRYICMYNTYICIYIYIFADMAPGSSCFKDRDLASLVYALKDHQSVDLGTWFDPRDWTAEKAQEMVMTIQCYSTCRKWWTDIMVVTIAKEWLSLDYAVLQ